MKINDSHIYLFKNNIYINTSSNIHELNIQNNKEKIIIYSKLFLILKEFICKCELNFQSQLYNLVNYILYNLNEFLKNQNDDIYEASIQSTFVLTYYKYYSPIMINKQQIASLIHKHKKIKEDFKDIKENFSQFSKFINDNLSIINKQLDETISNKEVKDASCNTINRKVKNVSCNTVNREVKDGGCNTVNREVKDGGCNTDSIEKVVNMDKEVNTDGCYMDIICEFDKIKNEYKTIISENKLLERNNIELKKDNQQKKRTLNLLNNLVKKYEKDKKDIELKLVKKMSRHDNDFVRNYNYSPSDLSYILMHKINVEDVSYNINIWHINCWKLSYELYQYPILDFYNCWDNLLLPKILELPGKYFKNIVLLWQKLFISLKECQYELKKIDFNKAFTTILMNTIKTSDISGHIPEFISILLNTCFDKHEIFLILKFYTENKDKLSDEQKQLIIDKFIRLHISGTPSHFIVKNLKVMQDLPLIKFLYGENQRLI